jgi:uncharacterized protein (TIGR02145 family)
MKKLTLLVAVIATSFTTFAQVGIGTTTPHASAALDITSTTSGFLPPRMTKVQLEAIASPVEGLMVYCTDCVPKTLYVFDAFNFVSTSNNTPSGFSSTDVYSTTGKTWMDRNLGATQVATSSTDAASYGNHYQWGKAQGFTSAYSLANNITGPVNDTAAAGTSFIKNSGDWLTVQDDARWNSGTAGAAVKVAANDPCPAGYRIPTDAELVAERVEFATQNAAGAWGSVLKLPVAGFRHPSSGALADVGNYGFYYSSTVSVTNARTLYFYSGGADMSSYVRAYGFSVRCIKE